MKIQREKTQKRREYGRGSKKQTLELSLLALPALVITLLFKYFPLVGLIMAFQDFKYNTGLFHSKFVGLKNFKFLFMSNDFIRITRNSIGYNLLFLIVGTAVCIFVALLLFEVKNKHCIKFFQTSFLLPNFLSMVIVGYIVYGFLNTDLGLLNGMIKKLGGEAVSWYAEKKYWPVILTLVHVWKGFGYTALVYYAALLGIDQSYYEAASIDGAGRLQQMLRISVPIIKPTIVIMALMSIGKIFYADFGLFYIIPRNSGVLYPVTDVIDTYVYRALQNMDSLGMASAVCFYQSVVGFLLVIVTNKLVKRFEVSNGLF